jgi:nucleotide-binding universal stress UspA family protein
MSEESVESASITHSGFPSFGRILVGYDGTEISKRALSYAAYFSKVSEPEIVVVNVVKPHRDFGEVLPLVVQVNLEGKDEKENEEQRPETMASRGKSQNAAALPLQAVVQELTTACKAAGLTKKNVICEIRAGENPADEIIDVLSLNRFDLIIMGSRKIDSKIEVIGSTTRKVITKVKTPILIVHKQPTYKDEY